MSVNDYLITFTLIIGAVLSVWLKKLTVPAAVTGALCGWLVYAGAGNSGILIMAVFFVLGTVATSWNLKVKQQLKVAEYNSGRRKASQVLANAGVAALAGLLIILIPSIKPGLQLLIAASFTSATADTLSSELGTVYGRNFYNVLTLRKDTRGLDGVVSLEGTLIGNAGSAFIASIYSLSYGWGWFGWLTLCGTLGNLADSLLGAALERRNILKNDMVNFLNTLIAGLLAYAIYAVIN
ncbi:DUF92 domain-containing protein [Mucilaginibacter lacusdianchii]|uniref:DUF92 domain-containing protein n=1 Tax=Mucilaginibacter lacusdianchii TaxID=2684211 RepID=UPI00131CB68E|nr:DUF92 domain-containing protein [Mucilaginibacter sp. JXJ CY 39]